MSAEPPSASAGPPPVADAQDPLPEGQWLWRRLFVFALTLGLLVLVWFKIDAVADVARNGSETAITGLVSLLRWCLGLIMALILFYLLAPSAEQLTKLIQTGAALRSGVAFRSNVSATSSEGAQATASSEAGRPVKALPTDDVAPRSRQ